MLTKIFSKYPGFFIKSIGAMSFLIGFFLIGYACFEFLFCYHFLDYFIAVVILIFTGYTFINGIIFIQYKTPLSWSVVVVNLMYWISLGLSFGVKYFYWYLFKRDVNNITLLDGNYNSFILFFIEGLILAMLLFIPLMIVHHSVFIEIYKVSFKRIVVSISLGILLFLIKSFARYDLI